jgi:hypothetical protein
MTTKFEPPSSPLTPAPAASPAELPASTSTGRSRSTAWYSEGQGCVVRIGNEEIVVTFLARSGRRARVKIEAPQGAEFESQ